MIFSSEIKVNEKGEQITKKVLNEISLLEAGSSFGELVSAEPMNIITTCKEDCDFAVLDKKAFKKILGKKFKFLMRIFSFLDRKEKQRFLHELDFLASIKLFSQCSYTFLKSLHYYCLNLNLRRGLYVYKEGDIAHNIYIVKSGEFQVTETYYCYLEFFR